MDFGILASELLDPGYTELTDEQCAVLLNTGNTASKKPISSFDIQRYLIISGVWPGIKNSTTDASITAIDSLESFDEFDIRDPLVLGALEGILDALVIEVTVPDFVASHKTAILAMGDVLISKATVLGLSEVNAGHVQAARNT